METDVLTFTNKIKVNDENNVVDEDEMDYQFLDRTNESNDSTASNARELRLEFLDSSNGQKYDRLVLEEKIAAPFKRRLSGYSRSNSPISFFPKQNGYVNRDVVEASTSNEPGQEEGATASHTSVPTRRRYGKRCRYNQDLQTRAEVLARRQKQIDYGKNTIGYDNYIKQIPRNKRSKDHPRTPPKHFKFSRRAFDGLIRAWRTKLHSFDPPDSKGTNDKHEDDCSSESEEDENWN